MSDLQSIFELMVPGHPYVLGTVVDVQGSAYRRPGARVLIERDGTRHGMISGGCLDKDVARHAWAWTENGPICALYDTRADTLHPHGRYGAGCDGVVKILLERVDTKTPFIQEISASATNRQALRMLTVYSSHPGHKWTGHHITTQTSVADYEPVFLRDLQDALTGPFAHKRPYSLLLEHEEHSLSVLVEHITPPPSLLILGAGEDARALSRIAQSMGWSVAVADKWPAMLTETRFPGARLHSGSPVDVAEEIVVGTNVYVVMMTHSFEDDLLFLPRLLASDAPFIGLMGPRSRTVKLLTALAAKGYTVDKEDAARIQTPVGLDLGADAPEEVALSIMGGLLAAKNGASAGLIRDKAGQTIHVKHERRKVTGANR